MSRLLEIGRFIEINQQVAPENKINLEPRVELLGNLTELNYTKKSTMDAHQYTLRG